MTLLVKKNSPRSSPGGRFIDMRQQHFGENQMMGGLLGRVRFDFRQSAFERHLRTGHPQWFY